MFINLGLKVSLVLFLVSRLIGFDFVEVFVRGLGWRISLFVIVFEFGEVLVSYFWRIEVGVWVKSLVI